jgi:hypothetical protein
VLKAGLAAGALAGAGAWRFAPGSAGSDRGTGSLRSPESTLLTADLQPDPEPYLVAAATFDSAESGYTVQASTAVPITDGLVVAIALGGTNPPTVSAVTDSEGNTYIPLQQSSTSPNLAVFAPAAYLPTPNSTYADASFTALPSGATFTITLPMNLSAGVAAIVAYGIPGQPVVDVSALFEVTNVDGVKNSPSMTGTPRQAGETALAIFAWADGGGTGTSGSPAFGLLTQQHPSGGPYLTVAAASVASVPSSLTASYTLSGSVNWYGVLLTFSTPYTGAYVVSSTTGAAGSNMYTVPILAASPIAPVAPANQTPLPALPAGDGAVLLIALGGSGSSPTVSVSDTKGNTWLPLAIPQTAPPQLYIFTAGSADAPGIATGLSAPFNGTGDNVLVEFGSDTQSAPSFLIIGAPMRPAVDISAATFASASSGSPSVQGTPQNGCELVLGLFAWANGGGTGGLAQGSSFTQIGQAHGGSGSYATAYYCGQAAPGVPLTAQATITPAAWRGVMLSFRVAAPIFFTNFAYINDMDSWDQSPEGSGHASCLALYGQPPAMSITEDPTTTEEQTTQSNFKNLNNSLNPGYTTIPILKYTSYEQLNTDINGPGPGNTGPNVIPSQFTWLAYDTEAWPQTPPANGNPNLIEPLEEEQDPWSNVRQFVALAHANGYRVMLAPALDLATVQGTLVPPDSADTNTGDTNAGWTVRTGVLAACAAAGADIVHCQCQSLEPQSATQTAVAFQELFDALYSQAQAQSGYCLITVGLRSDSQTTDASWIEEAYNAALPQAQGFWMNLDLSEGNAPVGIAVAFNQYVMQQLGQ